MTSPKPKNPYRSNAFYRDHYQKFLIFLGVFCVLMVCAMYWVMYQTHNRPLPLFRAVSSDGQVMDLVASHEPNLMPDTLLTWASQAAVAAYTYDFANYEKQALLARPYFTDAGWVDYVNSIRGLIDVIKKNQILVNGVVSGTPIISNQGPLPGRGYVWRVQIPFLVTYQSADGFSRKTLTVIMTIVRVPTSKNPQGIGIDQILM